MIINPLLKNIKKFKHALHQKSKLVTGKWQNDALTQELSVSNTNELSRDEWCGTVSRFRLQKSFSIYSLRRATTRKEVFITVNHVHTHIIYWLVSLGFISKLCLKKDQQTIYEPDARSHTKLQSETWREDKQTQLQELLYCSGRSARHWF